MRSNRIRWLLLLLAASLWLFRQAGSLRAHPADMYTQTYTLRFAPAGAELVYTLSPGPLLAASTWYEADADRDNVVSDAEAAAWLAPLLADWQSGLGDQTIVWQVSAVSWPADIRGFELGDAVITASLRAEFSSGGVADFWFYNPYVEALSINWFYLTGQDGMTFSRPQQENGRIVLTLAFPGAEPASLSVWNSGTPALAAGAPASSSSAVPTGGEPAETSEAVPAAPQDNRPYARLTALVRNQQLTPFFLISALGISMLLGAMHALTPGHGKALVAAYLVGTRGTPKHAAALGGVVTLTHTGSVLAIGLLTLLAARYLVPTDLFPILEIASGLLISAMGAALLWQRWRGWSGVQKKRTAEKAAALAEIRQLTENNRQPTKNEKQSTKNEKQLTKNEKQAGAPFSDLQAPLPGVASSPASRRRIAIGADIPVRVFDQALTADPDEGVVRWRSLVGLGVSGGLVPCPDAIAILLVAVALNRLLLGLSLIVSFSLGLAGVLIAIGLAMVQSRQLLARFGRVERHAASIAVASALVVLALGLGLTWNAVRGAGYLARAQVETAVSALPSPFPLKVHAPESTVSLETARVLYLVLDDQGMYQLHSYAMASGESVALTQATYGIWNFTLSPDRKMVVYAALRADRGSDLWVLDGNGRNELLLACPQSACRNATFAPDAMRLVYERLDISPENFSDTITLWWLDLADGSTAPVFQDASLPGFSPAWSPDGQWLSYIAPAMPTKIRLYNLADDRSYEFPTMTSMAVIWSPAGDSLLLTDVNRETLREGSQALTHLLRFDLTTAALTDISRQENVSDSWPAWSANGEQLAFVRRVFQNGQPERGNQIWVMRADGEEVRPVTQIPLTLHQGVSWSPDGRYLLYHRYDLETPLAKPAVWLVDLESGDSRELVNPGSQPHWLP